ADRIRGDRGVHSQPGRRHLDRVPGLVSAFSRVVRGGGTTMKAALRAVPVSAAMTSPVITIPDWVTVEQFLESIAPAHHFTTYPVHDPSGKLTGVVRLGDLVKVAGGAQAEKRLNALARPIAEVPTARPDE